MRPGGGGGTGGSRTHVPAAVALWPVSNTNRIPHFSAGPITIPDPCPT